MKHELCSNMLMILLLCLVVPSFSQVCPQGSECDIYDIYPNGEFIIGYEPNWSFLIKYKKNDYISINCNNSPDWKDFQLNKTIQIHNFKSISFSGCKLPDENQLSDIVKKLGADNISKLYFRFSTNLTRTLSRNSLKDFHTLEELTLSDNELTNITQDLFEDLPKLKVLNLGQNNLTKLPTHFLSIPSLRSIELSNNKLEIIEENAFDHLGQLTLLNLHFNNLVEIPSHSFDKLTKLRSLDLQKNKLSKLPSNIFSKLKDIKSINLWGNNFTINSLPNDLLQNNSNLQEFKLYDNRVNLTTLPNNFFGNLTKLNTVILSRNGLLYVSEDLFWGAVNLQKLSIDRNYIQTLPKEFFRDCTNLETLDLNFNDIENLPDEIFAPLTSLTELNLSKNRISSISSNLLSGMTSLKLLNMEYNNMKFIDTFAMQDLQNLRIAKFSHNQLTLKSRKNNFPLEFGSESPFTTIQSNIEELYLAYNNITEIFSDWKFATNLNTLDLSHNQLHSIRTYDLQFISTVNIDLSFNKIETINLSNNFVGQPKQRNVVVHIMENPIKCDCNIYNVLRYQEGRLHPTVKNLFDLKLNTVKCKEPQELYNVALSSLKSKSFECQVDSLKRNISCPSECHCVMQPDVNALKINCSNRGLVQSPKPPTIPPEFHHLHVELDLSKNNLSSMPSMSLWRHNNLTLLDLTDNKIRDISVNNIPENLEILHLKSNNFTRLNPDVIKYLASLEKLKNLTLHENNWQCDCDSRDFLSFIQTKQIEIPALQKIKCDLWDKPVFEMTQDELCPLMIEWIIGSCIFIALFGIIVGGFAAIYYRYQHEIKVWLFAHQCCMRLITENELDKDKLYDAFISYSHRDDNFVINDLVPKLEQGPNPFKLCVHYRDWLAGEWIPTQIARSVDDSRRTIVVLSPNFLESVWGRMEFRAAHKQALSEGRARLIVILYGDIGPTESLDPELKSYLSMNTYIKWGDPWFWEKLRYALPHRPELTKRKVKKQTVFQTYQPGIPIVNDKKELIDSNGSTASSSTGSTPPYNTLDSTISIENEVQKNAINNAPPQECNREIKKNLNRMIPQWTNV